MYIADLPFPKIKAPLSKYTLTEHLCIEQWVISKGTVLTLKQTQNFGLIILPQDCKDVRGFIIPRLVFAY